MKCTPRLIAFSIAAMLSPTAAQAVIEHPVLAGDAADFQQVLNLAAIDGEDSIVILPAGTYRTADNNNGQNFFYTSEEGKGIEIRGAGAGQTILDGGGKTRVLHIEEHANVEFVDNVRVFDLTIQEGFIRDSMQAPDNDIGAGLLIELSAVKNLAIENCEFKNNRIVSEMSDEFSGFGGGADIRAAFDVFSLKNNLFQGNSAQEGGGIANAGRFTLAPEGFQIHIEMQRNQFLQNQASEAGAGFLFFNSLTGERNNFEGNTAENVGGFKFNGSSIDLNANRFVKNQALSGEGGGLMLWPIFTKVVLTNNIIVNNEAATHGGGFLLGFAPINDDFAAKAIDDIRADIGAGEGLTFTHNTISGNYAGKVGGGAAIFTTDLEEDKEVVGVFPNPINFYNNIIFGNSAGDALGGDIYLGDFFLDDGENQYFVATVNLFNNDYGDFHSECVALGMECPNEVTEDASNIHTDPLFKDLANADVHLTAGSGAVDAGDTDPPGFKALDFDDQTRPFNEIPDMGALEAFPDIEVAPLNHNFGEVSVGDQESVEIVIANVGAGALTVSNLSLQQSNDIRFDVNGGSHPCGSLNFPLSGGESCTVLASFAPEVSGDQSNVLDVASNDPDEVVVPVHLLGTTRDGGFLEGSGFHCSLNTHAGANFSGILWMALSLPLLGIGRRVRRNFSM